jgi:hypothetical protein
MDVERLWNLGGGRACSERFRWRAPLRRGVWGDVEEAAAARANVLGAIAPLQVSCGRRKRGIVVVDLDILIRRDELDFAQRS